MATNICLLTTHSGVTGTLTIDCKSMHLIHTHVVVGAGNLTIQTTSEINGGVLWLMTKQDSVGGRTFGFGSDFEFPSGTVPVHTTDANAMDTWVFGRMHNEWHQHAYEADVRST